jgi:hypothetical protein
MTNINAKNLADVRIVYHREGFESPIGHLVRSRMESVVCEWLIANGIAHRHASEVFAVALGPTRTPAIYVPDIILHDKNKNGKTVIIEPIQISAPKGAGTKVFAAFRSQMKDKYYIIVVAKKQSARSIMKDAYDAFIDFDKLHLLKRRIPFPKL